MNNLLDRTSQGSNAAQEEGQPTEEGILPCLYSAQARPLLDPPVTGSTLPGG